MTDVIVLAGGAGTRATHLPPGTPKFLAPLRPGVTVGDALFSWLAAQGCKRAFLALGHGREAVLAYIQKNNYPLEIHHDLTPNTEDTARATRNALKARYEGAPVEWSNPILVVNGDTLLDIDLEKGDLGL